MAKTLTAGHRARRTHADSDYNDFWDSDAAADIPSPATPVASPSDRRRPSRSLPTRGLPAQRAFEAGADKAPMSPGSPALGQTVLSPGEVARRALPASVVTGRAVGSGSPAARAVDDSPKPPASPRGNRFVGPSDDYVVARVDSRRDDTLDADPPKPPGPPRGAFPGADEPARSGRPSKKTKKGKSKAATVFLVFGLVWLVAGLGMLGWVAWELWGTNIGVRAEYVNQISDLENQWKDPVAADPTAPAAPAAGGDEVAQQVTDPLIHYNLGQGFAILDIPKIGLRVPIIAGTDEASLARGVGWETYTQKPGEVGNFVVAGHHSSRGHPFDNLQQLVAGDEFTVETRDMIYTYRLLNSPADETVDFHETWVTLPDPINKSTEATKKMATLLTCKEFFSTPLRSIGFAEEISETPKA